MLKPCLSKLLNPLRALVLFSKYPPPPVKTIKAENNFKTLPEFDKALCFGEDYNIDRCGLPEEL
jgi:hypothetical protein